MDSELKKPKPVSRFKVATITSGIVAVAFGLLFLKFPSILNVAIRSQLTLVEDGPLFPKWTKVPIAVHYRYYFFEVLNPVEAVNGAKVSLREHGPYCFNQWRTKRIVKWGANDETVKYFEYKSWHFDPVCSGRNSLNDTFYMINPLFAALGESLADMLEEQLPMAPVTAPMVFTMVNSFLDMHQQSLFMKRSIGEVFSGFKINILDTIDTLTGPLKNMGIKLDALPPGPPDNMFGLLYQKNNTPEGPYEIYTGKGSTSSQLGYFVAFKEKTELEWWNGDYCNKLEGSDGTLFPAGVTKESRLSACAADICRCISFGYTGDSSFKDIPSYRFGLSLSADAFASPEKNPNNECFCIHKKKNKRHRCKVNGIMDLGGCQSKAPLILSGPHFLDTDPDLSKLVDGLTPDPTIHSTYVDIEPTTGAPIYGSKKLQISLRVERVPFLRNLQGVQNAFIPFLWAEEEGGLDDALADEMKGMLIKPVKVVRSGIFLTTILSFLIFFSLLILRCFWTTISFCLCCFKQKGGNTNSRIQPKKTEPYTRTTESNNNNDDTVKQPVQVKLIYPQPAQIQQRVQIPEQLLAADLQMFNQNLLQTLNETKTIKNQMEVDQRMNELRAENRELIRQQNQTQMMTQLIQQQQHPINPVPPTIIVNVTPSQSRSSTAVSRHVTSALAKVYSIANGQFSGHRTLMESIQQSNDPQRLEAVTDRRAVTSWEGNNKLEDITDDDGGNVDEMIPDEHSRNLNGQSEDIEWTGDQNEDRGHNQENKINELERHVSVNQGKEIEREYGETFSMWKARALGVRTGSTENEEITSISGRLLKRKPRLNSERKSVSIDIHESDTEPELPKFFYEETGLDAPMDSLQVEDFPRKDAARSRSFVTPNFADQRSSSEQELYKPYFRDSIDK